MRNHLQFIKGIVCGLAAACLLLFFYFKEDKAVQISKLASISSARSGRLKITGYLKRDSLSVKIYESFHRAYSEGGPIIIDTVDDQKESMNYVSVVGIGDYAFSRTAPPVQGVFIGEFERDNTTPNRFGILNIHSVEFIHTDSALYKGYVPK